MEYGSVLWLVGESFVHLKSSNTIEQRILNGIRRQVSGQLAIAAQPDTVRPHPLLRRHFHIHRLLFCESGGSFGDRQSFSGIRLPRPPLLVGQAEQASSFPRCIKLYSAQHPCIHASPLRRQREYASAELIETSRALIRDPPSAVDR